MIQDQKLSSDKRSLSMKHTQSMAKSQNILVRISLGQFAEAWNKEIACGTRCQFYQYRLQYIDYLKTLFIKKFEELLNLSFIEKAKEKEGYTLKYYRNSDQQNTKLILEIQAITENSTFKLAGHSPRMIFDRLGKSKDSYLLIINVNSVNKYPEEETLLESFTAKLEQLLLYFVVESYRIEPSLLKQLEESTQILQYVSYEQLERIKETQITRFELNLIDQSKSTEEFLRKMIESPHFCKQFDMVKVANKQGNRIKYVYKQSIKKPKKKDNLTFQDRHFSYQGFRKHISYMFPFWFTLELVLQNINEKPHCEVVLIPPLFSLSTKEKLAEKIKTYIINLSEATNTKALLNYLEKKHVYSSIPYELFINNKLRKSNSVLKSNGSQKQTVFKVPFLNVSAYPLYERFAHGNGLENIKKSALWKPHAIQNLQDTYVVKFQEEIFIITFREDMPFKDKKNLSEQARMRKLLIYEVYGLNTKVTKEEFDFEFRGRIRQAQLSPLLTKISQRLIEAPEYLNWSQLAFLQAGKKHSFKLTLPYMSCYGIYLSYLKQKLNYIHRKTSKKRGHSHRKMSHLDVVTFKELDTVRFSSFISENDLDEYEYSYNEEEDMLFLFNYAAPRGNSEQPFGKCIYLLTISLLQNNQKLQQICEFVRKQVIPTNSKKKSFYIYGVDPSESPLRYNDKFKKEVKQLIDNLNEIFPDKDAGLLNRDSDAMSNNSNLSGCELNFEPDIIPAERKYQNIEVEFNFQIIGNEKIDKIQEYCEIQIQSTYCDYLIESILFRLNQTVDEYIKDLPLMSKKKKKLSYDDIQCVIEDSLPHLLHLDKMPCMKKSLTIFNYRTPFLQIHDYLHLYSILMEMTRNIIQIINTFTGIVVKKVDMVYYILNSNKKLICYGSYSKLIGKAGQEYQMFMKSLSHDCEVGILFGSHISQLFDRIEEDSKKSSWTHSIKQYPDGRFFNSETFIFKRNFLLKLAVNREGIKYFSYNVNRNINYSVVKNIEVIVTWIREKQHLFEALKRLREYKKVEFPKRVEMVSSLSLLEVWDPYRELLEQKQYDTKKSVKPLSLTELFKSLVFQILPPIQKSQCMGIQTNQFNRIYELLMNQKIDFQKYGQLPKSLPYKCDLSRLGFQVLSILRYQVIKQFKKKQEEEDN